MMSIKNIEQAFNNVKDVVNKTPVMTSRTLNKMTAARVFLKCENFQRMGAFKFRGAYNAMSLLSPDEKKRGVITHSSGNHAQAVALAGQLLKIQATIVMPRDAPKVKLEATKGYGATVVLCDNTLDARIKTTEKMISEHNYVLIHPYDNDNVIFGQGTAAYELVKEVDNLELIVAPLGGGGLLSGTAIAAKGLNSRIKVFGVEPEMADDALRSLKAGKIIASDYPHTIADGLRTSLCPRTFNYIQQYVDEIVTVSEKEILEAMKFIWERVKIVVEPSGAVSLAAVLQDKLNVKNKSVGIIVSGGNLVLDTFFGEIARKIKNRNHKKK